MEHRLPQNLNVSFGGVEGEALLMAIDDIAVSAGAACASASVAPSHVLEAIGVSRALASASIRFGIGRFTTGEEIDYTIEKVSSVVQSLRARSALANAEQEDEAGWPDWNVRSQD